MLDIKQYIEINSEVRFGKPCIKGTRIAVQDILEWLSNNMSHQEILEDFPQLTNNDILAALAFAANREKIATLVSV
ncbi:MAG TPA: DUF433 domain-containing protein [Chitinophagales bacterium]|nr:DUF433 domain-containing protein [Chitinophagales bacterium]HNM32625.1 DUF433 domain-containing protein [Chitinophagales bacterium]